MFFPATCIPSAFVSSTNSYVAFSIFSPTVISRLKDGDSKASDALAVDIIEGGLVKSSGAGLAGSSLGLCRRVLTHELTPRLSGIRTFSELITELDCPDLRYSGIEELVLILTERRTDRIEVVLEGRGISYKFLGILKPFLISFR